ncbi:YraN family protein [Catenovulum sp. SM1970]|uniref:YraN family protein n=1 Tax=Marinifaba aquimaris TaxID=2741323 RepID=UPI00157384E1|nr:YraN family protein [Marinifaba aquimaris]
MTLFTKLTTRVKGAIYEKKAANFISTQGLSVIEQNWHVKGGELDLIAKQGNKLIFIEVKYRKSKQYGNAASTVTPSKQQKIKRAAILYMQSIGLNSQLTSYRFDIISFDGDNSAPNWIQNAF